MTHSGRTMSRRRAPRGSARRAGAAVLLAAVLCVGCAAVESQYVYVDSIAAPGSGDMKDYYLLAEFRRRTGVAGMEAGSSYERNRHRKFVALTHEALQAAGFRPVDTPDQAQLIISLNYAIDITRGQVRSERTSSVRIVAFDWAAVRDLDHRNAIWHTDAWMDNSSGGFGRVVPILIEAARPYLGKNTGGTVEVILR